MKHMIILYSAALLLIISCNSNSKDSSPVIVKKDSSTTIPVPRADIQNKDSLLKQTGNLILALLKNKKYEELPEFFANGDSVHFSPYAFIGSGSQALTAEDFKQLLKSNKHVHWGEQDGSGDSIILSLRQYIDKYVYQADFLNAPTTAVDSFIKTGNSVNNLAKSYPGSRFIEYHFPGFDKKYAGMDWTSLRLVFTEVDGKYFLKAIIHDQWTI